MKKKNSHVDKKEKNNTGLPDKLKSGIENLSGNDIDKVKVNYNSDKPAQLGAHAYADGTDIHLIPGQEKHLPHEAWHVVQQKQGRVKPTSQMKSEVTINDDAGLEKEADVMGTKALQLKTNKISNTKKEVAIKYLDFLEKGNIKELLKLFSKNGIVDSPVYGILNADKFYIKLANDTLNSELRLKGIFEENSTNNLALYFEYKWTVKNKKKVEFDVVDILEFNDLNQISKLKIIYDTVKSRELVKALKK